MLYAQKQIEKDILDKLQKIEADHDVQILLAVESGSRAWGFDSNNSDYDVRFVYLNNQDYYLDLRDRRDVIESMDGDLDFAGWDLKKTFNLFRKSNPPLMEWIDSPIVYKADPHFMKKMKLMKDDFWSPKRSMHHYLNLARNNYNAYIKDRVEVKHKKYLYVLRALLCCYWIEHKNTFPPMEFNEVLGFFFLEGNYVASEIDKLVAKKRVGHELGLAEKNPILSDLSLQLIQRYEKISSSTRDGEDPTEALNQLFRYYFYKGQRNA